MNIDHIGYAVKNIERATRSFEAVGFQFGEVIEDTDRNIYICFGENDGYRIELVAPLDKMKESPVDGILKGVGPTPYHICYKTEDITAALTDLETKGYKLIVPPAPAVAFGGKKVAFFMNLGTGLIEIVEDNV